MSHVDEGLLHAYLDGAFPPGDAQGEELEAHLRVCSDCRVRLEDARLLKDRAAVVLRHATPASIDVPPFETVLGRRGVASDVRKPSRPAWLPPLPLAWAATMVLALGAGWMANEVLRSSEQASVMLSEQGEQDGAAARAESDEAAVTARDQSTEPAASRVPAATPPAALADRPLTGAGRADADADAGERERRERAAAPPMPQAPPPPAVLGQTAARKAIEETPVRNLAESLTAGQRALTRRAADAAAPAPAGNAVLVRDAAEVLRGQAAEAFIPEANASRLAELLNDDFAATTSLAWTEVQPATAAAALGREPALIEGAAPLGLEVARIDERVLVRATYRLDDGARFELVQRADAADGLGDERQQLRMVAIPFPEAGVPLSGLEQRNPLFAGQSVVWLRRGGVTLLLRGPVAEDSLASLAGRIR